MVKAIKGKVYKRGNQWGIDFMYKKKRYREAVGPDEELAQDVLAKRKVEVRKNEFFPDKQKELDPIKFHDFAKEYLQWAKVNKKPSSLRRTMSLMRQLNKGFEAKILSEITTWQIEKYEANRKEEVKPATANRELALLKHMFTKAIE